MPWQQLVVDVGLELEEDLTPAYREVIALTPRQQGKTTLNLSVETHRAISWPSQPQRISYSAQTGWDGHKKLLDDQVPILQRSSLWKLVARVFRAAGADGVLFSTGSRIDVMASGEAAGHGKVVDLGMIDEAFADVDDRREQAMVPAMMTKRDAQLWVTSTAGHEGSVYLKRKVDAGRSAVTEGVTSGIAYFEWSAPPEAPIDDPATWWGCMPALGHTVSEDVIRSVLLSGMPENEFRRAFLNQWTVGEDRIIPSSIWNAVCGEDVSPEGNLTFGIDASPDRSWGSIVACDSQRRCELVEHREGVGWLAARAAELGVKYSAQVAADSRGPAASALDDLEVRGAWVVRYGSSEMAAATARLYDALADGLLSIRRNVDLDVAAGGARKRTSGDQWYWGRSNANVDISPLVALTLAHDLSVANGPSAAPSVRWS